MESFSPFRVIKMGAIQLILPMISGVFALIVAIVIVTIQLKKRTVIENLNDTLGD